MGYRNIKKQKNLFLFFKLRILIFQCPGTTHITNFTRMPRMCSVAEWEGGRTRAVASKYMGGKLILNGGQIAKQRPFPFMKTLITALHAEICTKCGADVAS